LIVLQHNPPPITRLIVRAFLKALNPGVAYFQVPTNRGGYRFSPGEHLENEAKKHVMMEMHVLPQRVNF